MNPVQLYGIIGKHGVAGYFNYFLINARYMVLNYVSAHDNCFAAGWFMY